MAETHPDYIKHMQEREWRVSSQDGIDEYPPLPHEPEEGTPAPVYSPDRHYGAYPSAAEVVRAWRERNGEALSSDHAFGRGDSDSDRATGSRGSTPPGERQKRKNRRKHHVASGNFSSWFGHSSRDYDVGHRSHHSVRNSVRDMVRSAVTSDNPARSTIAHEMLEECKENCRAAGVTFGEVLSEDMEGLGVPPLVYEIFSCWEDAGLLQFLLENTPARHVDMFVRRGCMMRGDNGMFQALRSALAANETVDIVRYDMSLREEEGKIHVEGSIADMPELLTKIRTLPNERKRPLPLPVEWIAAGRLWCIEPTNHDSILLRLVEGDPIHLLDADLTIVARDAASSSGRKNSMAVSMMKDKSVPVTLVPLSQSGTNNILFIPFSPMEDRLTLPACLSADGALHFLLTLTFAVPSNSDSDSEDWEHIGQEQDWVLASYAGKDAETRL
ncbi:hypothetical protein CALCODRAFT_496205 [Calocera cornea HHB12733]|uniref:Uncharacterized protein n=1 Tax=Calocera cornea HHB12733 TaxID=1353952 RepID=A0A165FZE5_9BASI|nr:hypothetical protein CALCODRAFT_496205 [Calocera cornea HHB12733]